MEDSPSDEQITMLMCMGFGDINEIHRALKVAKNDINEAVAILTGEDTRGGFGQPDVEMKEVSNSTVYNNNNSPVMFGPQVEEKQPIESVDITDDAPENIDMAIEDMPDEFPVTNMYELEDRVFTENWSIPYKKDESLAKCLYGAIKLASQQKAEADKDCARFLDRVAVECFKKLLTSPAVKKWAADIHDGVFNMIQLFIDFMAQRLKYAPPPLKLLGSLYLVFDPESDFHLKNRKHKWNRGYYEDIFGYDKCPAVSPDYNTYKAPYGWLVDLINRFVQKGGLDCIIDIVETMDKMSSNVLASLLKPFGVCAPYLNPEVIGFKLGAMADKVVQFISQMKADDMKDKEVDKVYDLLRTLRKICDVLWPDKTSNIVELHLSTILKMLQLPQFNPRMNAMKELSRLIKDAERNHSPDITVDAISKWLIDNKVLSIAFSSSLHHAQYCEKLQKIVEFASSKISLEEFTTIWNMQIGKHITVIDNIHSIIASAIQSFSVEQMDHFLTLLEKSWKDEDDKSKERLLLLLGKVGREVKEEKIVTDILSLLWRFSHLDDLPLYLINQAVQSHIDVLTESTLISVAAKTDYITKCVQDIKNNLWVVPGIRHILCNLQSVAKQPNNKNAGTTIQEIQNQNGLLKLLTASLGQSHKTATASTLAGTLSGETVINNRYRYAEIVITHLKLIEFLLQEGNLYLSWHRTKEIWDCLMLDTNNCEGDYETCLEWFLNCIGDLQPDTQKDLFTHKILKTDISKIKEAGFKCFKSYFETVNIAEHKMTKPSSKIVEKQDLTGLPYLWQLVLESPYTNIAEEATKYLIDLSYTLLSAKLKKGDTHAIHKRFTGECHKRLEYLLSQLKENEQEDCSPKEGKITRTFKKPHPIKGSTVERSKVLLSIQRLLNVACNYIIVVEDGYSLPRHSPPHGSCFHGYPIQIHVACETNKTEVDLVSHSNETLSAARRKIAVKLDCSVEAVQVYMNDKIMLSDKNHKLLSQLEFQKKQNLNVKIIAVLKNVSLAGASASSSSGASASSSNASAASVSSESISSVNKHDREKCLPSFILAVDYKVYDKLYQLAELEEAQITCVLRNLLQLLPTDRDVLEAIDVFSFQNPMLCSPGTLATYTTSSSSVIENYFKCTAPKMSTFRVLYNLQVLSSKLMPVDAHDTSNMAHSFCENWLNAGGLRLIMNILLPDTLPNNADYELRQSCYYIILQLAKFLLCGEPTENDSLQPPFPVNTVVRTYGETTADESQLHQQLQQQCSQPAFSLNSTMASETSQLQDVSMNVSASTPIKVANNNSSNILNASATSNTSPMLIASSWPGARISDTSPGAVRVEPLSSSPGSASAMGMASFTPDGKLMRKRLQSTSSVLETVSPTVKRVVENINEDEFREIISSLMQVTWSAAAGQLQLNTRHARPAAAAPAGGTTMTATETFTNPFMQNKKQHHVHFSHNELKAGLCLRQEFVSIMDSVLANNSLELLVMCLQIRPKLIEMFYKLPNVAEFVVDVLTGSPSIEVRSAACCHFSVLSNTTTSTAANITPPLVIKTNNTAASAAAASTVVTHPKAFLIATLLSAQLPVWNVSGTIRGTSYKLLLQCQQYFELLSSLLCTLSLSAQSEYGVNPTQLLQQELSFLQNSDNLNVEMLTGHLTFSNALLTCEGIDKATQGHEFLSYLLDEFLFSASKLENAANTSLSTFSVLDINIHSFNSRCRKEAFDLLLTTADRCPRNIRVIAEELARRHHSQVISEEWAFQPAISARPANGFVGLSNAGATCYMNSILQQLYMQPGVREALLKVDDQQSVTKDTVLSQVQNIFGHLLESQTQFYKPEGFWKTFKLWGEPVNVREQQDALEFYTNITDQLDEHLRTTDLPASTQNAHHKGGGGGGEHQQIFKSAFCGTFVDQKTCSDCAHCFERDEPFSSLPVTVKSGNLEQSLEQFVQSEVMEGDNAYYCEKCRERRTTVKRTCIKKLPAVLVIQLKRFWYDWERNRAIKFDDFFKFPTVLDMEPYTKEGIKKMESEQLKNGRSNSSSNSSQQHSQEPIRIITDNQRYYELVGVVVHSGQASAGHYYSFVKNRQSTVGEYNQWYKFNDTYVEKFDMTEEALEQELFGGEYKVPQTEGNNQYPENRVRNWNAYMLFYESMDKSHLPPSISSAVPMMPHQDPRGQMFGDIFRSYPPSPVSSTASSNPPSPGSKDSLSQLSALIRKGEKKGLFAENMPTYVKKNVNENNKEFMCNCDIYNQEYFMFVRELCNVNTKPLTKRKILEDNFQSDEDEAVVSLIQLGIQYLLNTYFKTAKSFRADVESWQVTMENLLNYRIIANTWFCNFFAQAPQRPYLVMYLLECPEQSTRDIFSKWLLHACGNIFNQFKQVTDDVDNLVVQILSLLEHEAPQYIKQSAQYFDFFYKYSLTLSFEALEHLYNVGAFRKFHTFLLGPRSTTNPEKFVRRWSASQTMELSSLHRVMMTLIINASNEALQSVSTDAECPHPKSVVKFDQCLDINLDLKELVYGPESDRYLHEMLFAAIEIPHTKEAVHDVIMYGCWCNLGFSMTFFQQMEMFLSKAQVSDFVNLLPILKGVLLLEDPHQKKRIEYCISGSPDDNIDGLFEIIHVSRNENGRRAYECIKFLTNATNQLGGFKEYLSQGAKEKEQLEWAVKWLEKKINEGSFWPTKSNTSTPSFRRTTSEQNTLVEATKLLTEMGTRDGKPASSVIVEIT